MERVVDVWASIMETAMRAFSAMRLLFCSLALGVVAALKALAALGVLPSLADMAAKRGEFLRNKAAVDGSNMGGPGGGPWGKPMRPNGGGIMPGGPGMPGYGPKSVS